MSKPEQISLTVSERQLLVRALGIAISRHGSQARWHDQKMRIGTASRHEQTAEKMRDLRKRLQRQEQQ